MRISAEKLQEILDRNSKKIDYSLGLIDANEARVKTEEANLNYVFERIELCLNRGQYVCDIEFDIFDCNIKKLEELGYKVTPYEIKNPIEGCIGFIKMVSINWK